MAVHGRRVEKNGGDGSGGSKRCRFSHWRCYVVQRQHDGADDADEPIGAEPGEITP